MTLARKIDDILHGRVACDDKLQAIGAAVAVELALDSADASEIKAPFKTPVHGVRDGFLKSRLVAADGETIFRSQSLSMTYSAAAAINAYEKDKALIKQLVEALRRADQFITNGIDLGFIRMPDKTTPDTAHETPKIVRAALAAAKEAQR